MTSSSWHNPGEPQPWPAKTLHIAPSRPLLGHVVRGLCASGCDMADASTWTVNRTRKWPAWRVITAVLEQARAWRCSASVQAIIMEYYCCMYHTTYASLFCFVPTDSSRHARPKSGCRHSLYLHQGSIAPLPCVGPSRQQQCITYVRCSFCVGPRFRGSSTCRTQHLKKKHTTPIVTVQGIPSSTRRVDGEQHP